MERKWGSCIWEIYDLGDREMNSSMCIVGQNGARDLDKT